MSNHFNLSNNDNKTWMKLTSSRAFRDCNCCCCCCCCCIIAPDAFGIDVEADKLFELLLALMLLLLLLLYTDDGGGWLLEKLSSNKLGMLGNVCCVLLAFHLLLFRLERELREVKTVFNDESVYCHIERWDNLQWRLLRTPMWIWRRTLQRRMFWHKIQNVIFSQAGRDACLRAVTSRLVLNLASSTRRAWCNGASNIVLWLLLLRWRWWGWGWGRFAARVSSCLFHLNVAMQLLQKYLIRITVDDQDAFLLSVVALIAFECCIRNPRTI